MLDGPLLNAFYVKVVADIAWQYDDLRLLGNEFNHTDHTFLVLSEDFWVVGPRAVPNCV